MEPDPVAVLEEVEDVVFRTDAAGTWTYLNSAWTVLTGFSVAESLGTNFMDYVHPEEREHTIALFMAVAQGGAERCHHETRYRRKDGGYRLVQLRSRLLLDGAGRLVANAGTISDLTERRRGEELLADHQQVLELASGVAGLDDLPLGILLYSAELTLERASPVLRRLLGPVVDPGHPVADLVALLTRDGGSTPVDGGPRDGGADELGGPWGLIETARATARPQYGALRLSGRAGRRRSDFHVSVLPRTGRPGPGPSPGGPGGGHGQAGGALALVLHDVSDLRRAERQQGAVGRLGQRALTGVDITLLWREAALAVVEVLDLSHCEVLELRRDGRSVRTRAAVGWQDGSPERHIVRDHPLLGAVRGLDGEATWRYVADTQADPVLSAQPWMVEPGIVCSLGVGIDLGGEPAGQAAGDVAGLAAASSAPFGVLAVHSTAARAFGAEEIAFLSSVATILAAAMQRRRTEDATRHQALHDPLTGLANRVLLAERLELALALRHVGRHLALLLMDLDRFKEINDTLGHDVGDTVLQVLGDRLAGDLRLGDTVARLGGDEFAVVVADVAGVEDATALAQKLRARVGEVVEYEGLHLRVDASVGVVLAPEHGNDPVALLKRADVAMYRAKAFSSGVAVYAPDIDENHPQRLAYHAALRAAIEDGQLVVHYQPKIDLGSGEVCAVEALVRWQHPVDGLVLPESFVPLAERTGLIRPLTWQVLRVALEQVRTWLDLGHEVPVAVNISARMLHDADLATHVHEELERLQLPAHLLELEVTETAVMSSPVAGGEALQRLKDLGVRLSLDDFGTGYSSLARLRDLPVHRLKIDRSFVTNVATNSQDASIVRSVIDLGHNLGLGVVGEGVETEAACDLLRSMGCDEAQGYHLGRPVAAVDVRAPLPGVLHHGR